MPTKPMFQDYKVELLIGRLMGGIPKSKDLIAGWLEVRKPTEPELARQRARAATAESIGIPTPMPTLVELAEQVVEALPDTETTAEDKVWCGFKGNDQGLYVDGYHLKSHLKDCAEILRKYTEVGAQKAKTADRLFVVEPRLYLGKGEPDGFWEHPVHVRTAQGPRSALKRTDYVVDVLITATLRVLNDGTITEALLRQFFDFGSIKGFGAERGLGEGRYEYTLTTVA
ncbi:MAG: hypothetical protein Q8R28_11210 [Dehalococcoidia bacterium]|nr:hypothetical protein [Dehalococcoidia bacterium]